MNVNPGMAQKAALSQVDYPYEPKVADKIYVSHLVDLKNRPSPQYGQGASALTTSSMLNSGPSNANAATWINGCDVRYELSKHLGCWNEWPGLQIHEDIWRRIHEDLTTLSSFYDNVNRLPYDYQPPTTKGKSLEPKRREDDEISENRFRLKQ